MAHYNLENNIREALIHTERAKGCLVYDFVLEHIGAHVQFSINEIVELGLNERLTREGLKDSGLFVPHVEYSHTKGRPRTLFVAKAVVTVRDELGLEASGHADALSAKDFKNVPTYKAALHHAMIERMQKEGDDLTKSLNSKLSPCVRYGDYGESWFQMTRKFQSNRLSVSASTIRRYEKERKILTKPQFTELDITPDMQFHLPRKLQASSDKRYFIVDMNGKAYPAIEHIAQRLTRKQGYYTLKTQTANVYRCA